LPSSELTPQERRLELVLRLFSLLFFGFAVGYLIGGAQHEPTEFPFVANSVAKDGMFAILAFVAAGDIRRNGWAAILVIAGHVLIVASLLFMFVLGRTESVDGSFGEPFGISLFGGMRNRTSQWGQIPRFPAKKSLTFSRCPLGQ